jgi:SWI/SNF-related matrix-associated actin-dependent regulator 1 of chromatin subfamily A
MSHWSVKAFGLVVKEKKVSCPKKPSASTLTASGKLYRKYDRDAVPVLKSLPGAEWCGSYWQVSTDEGDRHRILEAAQELGIEVDPSLQLPLSPAAIKARDAGLYPFQVQGVDWLSRRQKALLADEMGLGKTAQTLLALPDQPAVLAVTPACLKYNWKEEATRWRPDLNVTVVKGKKDFRLPNQGEMVVVSYDCLPDEIEPATTSSVHLIADESHKVKGRKTKRHKAIKKLSRLVLSVWALTGTPLLNNPDELFAMLDALDFVGETYKDWSSYLKLFNIKRGRWDEILWGDPKPEVKQLLLRVMLRRLRYDVLPQLPTKQYQTILVPLPDNPSLMEEMNELWGKYRCYLEDQDDLPPLGAMSAVRERLARTRIKAMKELVELYEEQGEPLVVFSDHRAPIEELQHRQGWGVILGDTPSAERQRVVAQFQAGDLKGVAATIQAGGTGLTMTNASTVLFVDLDWVPANNIQAEDRVCRIGQEANKVQIVRLVSDHILDQRVLKVLDRKAKLARKVIG